LGVGLRYFEAVEREQCAEQFLRGVHLDFGAGWQPTIPLLYYAMGVERQYLFDLVPVMEGQTVKQTVETFRAITGDANWPHRAKLRRLPPLMGDVSLREYFEGLGISYCAPYAAVFPTLAGQVDLVTSTQVLLHIPRETMRWCFCEILKSLKPGGLFLATAYLKDLFADRHKGLPRYNHLRYSAETWERWVNSPLMSFNRFKARDYRELLEGASFQIRRFDIEEGTAEDLRELEKIGIAPCFKGYSRAELAAKDLFFVAQKR
jgi:SAM-dependent methyltransferase